MKKLLSVLSLATIVGVGALSAQSNEVVIPGTEKNSQKSYLVTLDGEANEENKERNEVQLNEVLNELAYKLPKDSYTIDYTYDTVMNGFAVKTYSGLENVIKSISHVASVEESHSYSAPAENLTTTTYQGGVRTSMTPEEVQAAKLVNYSAETMHATGTDITAAIKDVTGTESASQGGKNVSVGIIDTGLFLNQVEGTAARTAALATAEKGNYTLTAPAFKDFTDTSFNKLTAEKVAAVAGLKGSNYTRINNKIPFSFDYADNDGNVDPTGGQEASEHGTHVASMASANGTAFQGIAPNAQVAVLKVFGNNAAGAGDTAIIAALEDSAKLGLDVVNLSLGSDLIDDDDTPTNGVYQALEKCSEAGVIVNFAAGNSGKSSYSGSKGYSDWTTDTVETSITGSEAHMDEGANIVAASNPNRAFYSSIMTIGDTAVSYDDQVINKTGSTIHYEKPLPFSTLIPEGQDEVALKYVRIGGLGAASDYTDDIKASISAGNNVAVVDRGSISFTEKIRNATSSGAKAVIVVNNDPSLTFNFSFDFNGYEPTIPVVLVYKSMSSIFGAAGNTGDIKLATNTVQESPDGNVIASFSSDGPSYNLDISPTIAGPGKQTMGAVVATNNATNSGIVGYDNFDGTSMATPNVTGAMALTLGEKNPDNNGDLASASAEKYATFKSYLSSIAMSTADQLVDTTKETLTSPRMQGAGVINPRNILATNSYVSYHNQDVGEYSNTFESKVELKNTGSLKVSDFTATTPNYVEFEYTIHNESANTRTYKPALSLMIPSLRVQQTQAEYDESDATSKVDVPVNLPSTITMSVNDDEVAIPEDHQLTGTVVVPAMGSVTATAKVRIDDLAFSKKWNDVKNADFTGTLKEYIAKYFKDAGGTYVEGYLNLNEVGKSEDTTKVSHKLSVPYMGFYGDYTVGKAVEDFDFEKEDGRLYNSEMIDSYVQNLSNAEYRKSNAYTGSTLTAVASNFSSTNIENIAKLNTSGKADGATKLSLNYDIDSKLHAGSASANTLLAVFFVNRSISDASWSIKKGSTSVSTGKIADYGYASGGITSSGSLTKSWLYTGDGIMMHHGIAQIPLSAVNEGEYTLEFSFALKGVSTTQKKTYTLVVDKTDPVYEGVATSTSNNKNYMTLTTNGGNAAYYANSIGYNTAKVAGSSNSYSAKIALRDTNIENESVLVSAQDINHNESKYLINPLDTSIVAKSSQFTNKMKISAALLNSSGGQYQYDFAIADFNDNPITLKADYEIYVQLATGLTASDLDVSVDSEDQSFTYDATTGILTIKMPRSAAGFTINSKLINKSTLGEQTSSGSSSSSSSSSSSTSDNTSSSTSGGGCGGSIIAVSSIVGAAALVGVGLLIKKKREDK